MATIHLMVGFMSFGKTTIAKELAQKYNLTLSQMVVNKNVGYTAFISSLYDREEAEEKAGKIDSATALINALSRMELFQECDQGFFQQFRGGSRLEWRFEGDRITEKELTTSAAFVVEGRLARSIETAEGWYVTMDILRENRWINDNVLSPGRMSKLSAEVLTGRAKILFVPLGVINDVLEKSPTFARNVVISITRQMEKFQKLWLQS